MSSAKRAPPSVEFRLQRVDQVSLRRGTIVLTELDRETVRRKLAGRWQRLGPPRVQQDRIVVERPNGDDAHEPSGGPTKRRLRQRTSAALVGAV